ncbi:C-C chemokine receptor type 6 [Acomys russatus]|uniref:C-C chemokine receptor type 6 n=1 Tax=Acomys russatus TaxID=60746 RepID=UPI0021E22A17|nr:C-C chemokine receptor type 6 [Acomys russatus]XP_051020165.1 C-C chemokine receptor type 6 [Acomys russatus]
MNSTEAYYYLDTAFYSVPTADQPCSLEEVRQFTRVFVPIAYSLICVFGLLGNIMVVMTFAFYKKARSMTDVYLLNMAITDILFVLTLPFWAVTHATDTWVFSNVLCKLMKGIYAVNFNCGMLLLACISMDRYVAIVQATKSFRVRSRTLAHSRVICVVVWLISVIISSPTFTFNEKYQLQGRDVCEPRYRSVREPITWKLLGLGLQLLFGFFIPLLFMTFCYLFIIKTLVQAQNSKRHRAIRVVIAVVLVFLACEIPHNAVLLVTAVNTGKMNRPCSGEKLRAYVGNVAEVLAFLHCCLNPVLYAFIGQKFRNYFMKIMKDVWCARRLKKAPGFLCARVYSESYASRQTSEITDNDNASSFTM